MVDIRILNFLEELKHNNNRDWFDKNRNRYKEASVLFSELVSKLIPAIAEFDKRIKFLEPKDCIFRIFRDVRFSNDKSPYKTNFGSYIVQGGRKAGNAGYYLHIEPGNSFLGGGVYCPPQENLNKIRTGIVENTEEYLSVTNSKDFKKYFIEVLGDRLTKIPRGFDASFPNPELLKLKSYTIIHRVSDSFLTDSSSIEKAIDVFRKMKPLNDFINEAIA